jgi:hypothetical protein
LRGCRYGEEKSETKSDEMNETSAFHCCPPVIEIVRRNRIRMAMAESSTRC